jgi:putative oxidoreductase
MKLLRTNQNQADLGLALIRIIVGLVFAVHGGQKLFVYGLDGVAGAFTQMGIPMAAVAGPAVAFLEFFGGIALILGLLTRLAGLGLAINMIGAILFVHAKAGFFLPNGYEFVLTLFAGAAALVIAGAGRYSVDALLGARKEARAEARIPVRRAA